MIYEDLFSLWLFFIIYFFAPSLHLSFSPHLKLFLFFFKEAFFFSLLIFFKKTKLSFFISRYAIFSRIIYLLIFCFFLLDISFFKLDSLYPFSSFPEIFMLLIFLHYYLPYRFLFFSISLNYLKIFLSFLLPFLIADFFLFLWDKFFEKHEFMEYLPLPILLVILAVSPVFMVRLWEKEELSSEDKRRFLSLIESFGLKVRDVILLKSSKKGFYTAGILGFSRWFRFLFISKELYNLLSLEELKGVIAHEAGHVKKRHFFWIFILIFIFSMCLGNLIKLYLEVSFLKDHLFWFGFFLILFSIIYLRFFFAYFLRNFEREADFMSYLLCGRNALALISALLKIGSATGRLYEKNWHHYGLLERISFLTELMENPKKEHFWKIHFLKLKIFLFLLCAFFLLLFVL